MIYKTVEPEKNIADRLLGNKYSAGCLLYMYDRIEEGKITIKKTELLEVCNNVALNAFLDLALEAGLVEKTTVNEPQTVHYFNLTPRGLDTAYMYRNLMLPLCGSEELNRRNKAFNRERELKAFYLYDALNTKKNSDYPVYASFRLQFKKDDTRSNLDG